MIAGSRVTGLLVVAPFLGSAAVPPRIKIGLAFLLTLFLVPLVPRLPARFPLPRSSYFCSANSPSAYCSDLPSNSSSKPDRLPARSCGVQMGYSLASIVNPDNSQADSAVLSTFYELIVLLLFIQLGVPR